MKRRDTRRSVLTAASRHSAVSGTPGRAPGQDTRLPRVWAGLSAGAALLAIAGSAVGLLAAGPIYSHETSAFRDAAAAQDLVNLVLVGPLLLALAVRAYRGSLRSWLGWLGCLSFTVYNYAIYVFSIHFGALFLVWIGVLGLSLFALIGGLRPLGPSALKGRLTGRPVNRPGGSSSSWRCCSRCCGSARSCPTCSPGGRLPAPRCGTFRPIRSTFLTSHSSSRQSASVVSSCSTTTGSATAPPWANWSGLNWPVCRSWSLRSSPTSEVTIPDGRSW